MSTSIWEKKMLPLAWVRSPCALVYWKVQSLRTPICSIGSLYWISLTLYIVHVTEKHVAFTPGIDFEDPSTKLGDRRFRISYAGKRHGEDGIPAHGTSLTSSSVCYRQGGIDTATQAMERLTEFWTSWRERVAEAKASDRPLKQQKVEE